MANLLPRSRFILKHLQRLAILGVEAADLGAAAVTRALVCSLSPKLIHLLGGALARDLEVLNDVRWLSLHDLRYLFFADVIALVAACFNFRHTIPRLYRLRRAHYDILVQVLARVGMHRIIALKLHDLRLRLDTRLVAVVLRTSEACIVLPNLLLNLLLYRIQLSLVLASLVFRIRLVGLGLDPVLR